MISPRPAASNKPRLTPINASSCEVAALIEQMRRQEDAHRRVLAEQVLLQAEHTRLQTVLTQREAALKHAECRNQTLIFELAHLRRLRYGVKSEALNAHQRALFEEGLDANIAACEARIEQEQPIRPHRTRAGRQPLPEHLPRIERPRHGELREAGEPCGSLEGVKPLCGAKPSRRASAQVAKAELMLGGAGRDARRDVPCVTQHSEDKVFFKLPAWRCRSGGT